MKLILKWLVTILSLCFMLIGLFLVTGDYAKVLICLRFIGFIVAIIIGIGIYIFGDILIKEIK